MNQTIYGDDCAHPDIATTLSKLELLRITINEN